MFDREKFRYDSVNHIGYYNGKIVPSVTQLVNILYPLDDDIPESRLKSAAEKGTQMHSKLEDINELFVNNNWGFYSNLKQAIDYVNDSLISKEEKDYVSILQAFQLEPHSFEQLVFLLDENANLICYGHYDLVVKAKADITFDDEPLFIEDHLYLLDYKRTSLSNRIKTQLQLNIYKVAYEQMTSNQISGLNELWFNDGLKLLPLKLYEKDYIIELCKRLAKSYAERN